MPANGSGSAKIDDEKYFHTCTSRVVKKHPWNQTNSESERKRNRSLWFGCRGLSHKTE